MRELKEIAIHCSATKPDQVVDTDIIRQWHLDRGWSDIGYHYIIERDGSTETGRPIERAGAHVQGNNQNSIGICLVGGIDKNGKPDANYTRFQWDSLEFLVSMLTEKHKIQIVKGHRDYGGVSKVCPCFDVRCWWYGVSE